MRQVVLEEKVQSQPLRIRLFVADSSPISSQLLAEAMARDAAIEVLGFSSSPSDVLRATRTSNPEVLLISARMEDDPMGGLSLLRQLRTERPGLKAIVLMDSSRPDLVVGAFRAGASGVFCRSVALQMLRKCISAVHGGEVWANSEELGFVLAALSAAPSYQLDSKRLTPLSVREREVVRCLVEGLTNREIAETLGISQHTVKNYMFKIFDKLGVSNRVELVFQVLSGSADLLPAPTAKPIEEKPRRSEVIRLRPQAVASDDFVRAPQGKPAAACN